MITKSTAAPTHDEITRHFCLTQIQDRCSHLSIRIDAYPIQWLMVRVRQQNQLKKDQIAERRLLQKTTSVDKLEHCFLKIFTARKPSLWQVNAFIPVCHSVHGGDLHPGGGGIEGGCPQEGSASGGVGQTPPSDTTGYCKRAGGTHPTGMHSCYYPKLEFLDLTCLLYKKMT